MVRSLLATVTLGVVAVVAAATVSASTGPLRTAIVPDEPLTDALANEIASTGATAVQLILSWPSIVSPEAGSASDFDPTSQSSKYYDWSSFDAVVRVAASHGLDVTAQISDAPDWALVAAKPGLPRTLADPTALGQFASAAASRYSGLLPNVPRVRNWEISNEPNISLFFVPQFVDNQPFSPNWYRAMVNAVSAAVKGVDPTNLVIAGGTAPFFDNTPEVTAVDSDWGPLSFMRRLLCLDADLHPTCSATTRFDVWAHHPYTSGGPFRSAALPNDVSLGDLPEMHALLQAAQSTGSIVSGRPVQFWVTEFSWDSNPPDPRGVPVSLLQRWVPLALYQMWRSGVSLVTWFTVHDTPFAEGPYQAGLLYRGDVPGSDAPKPFAKGFSFPLVGISHRDRLSIWGRTPSGGAAEVAIDQSFSGGWSQLGTVTSDAAGIFQATFTAPPVGRILARVAAIGAQSDEFPLGPDAHTNDIYEPFGGGRLEPIVQPARPRLPHATSGGSQQRIIVEQRLRGGARP